MNSKGICRRQVLRAGGISIGLPFLPSLLPRGAAAQTPGEHRYFVALHPYFSGIAPESFFPGDNTASTVVPLFAGMKIHHGPLVSRIEGNDRTISPALTAPSSIFTPSLLGKMNVVNGLDIPFYCGYHYAGWLGNNRSQNDRPDAPPENLPTIDQVLAWSPRFYRNEFGLRQRSLNFSDTQSISFGYAEAPAHRGAVKPIPAFRGSTRQLFLQLVSDSHAGPLANVDTERKAVLDLVVERVRGLRQSNRRMSAADKLRLDEHLERLRELERSLAHGLNVCPTSTVPQEDSLVTQRPGPADVQRRSQLINDIIVAAFSCGTSRIAVSRLTSPLIEFAGGSFHQDVEHSNHEPAAQLRVVENQRMFFANTFMDLIAKMDQVPNGQGGTLLDDAVVQWGLTHSYKLHYTISLPAVIAGSAGGQLRTGQYLDYRNRDATVVPWMTPIGSPGLHINRWFRTLMETMGVSHSEYSDIPYDRVVDDSTHKAYQAAYVAGQHHSRNDPLPLMR